MPCDGVCEERRLAAPVCPVKATSGPVLLSFSCGSHRVNERRECKEDLSCCMAPRWRQILCAASCAVMSRRVEDGEQQAKLAVPDSTHAVSALHARRLDSQFNAQRGSIKVLTFPHSPARNRRPIVKVLPQCGNPIPGPRSRNLRPQPYDVGEVERLRRSCMGLHHRRPEPIQAFSEKVKMKLAGRLRAPCLGDERVLSTAVPLLNVPGEGITRSSPFSGTPSPRCPSDLNAMQATLSRKAHRRCTSPKSSPSNGQRKCKLPQPAAVATAPPAGQGGRTDGEPKNANHTSHHHNRTLLP